MQFVSHMDHLCENCCIFQLSTAKLNSCGDVSLLMNELKNKGHLGGGMQRDTSSVQQKVDAIISWFAYKSELHEKVQKDSREISSGKQLLMEMIIIRKASFTKKH